VLLRLLFKAVCLPVQVWGGCAWVYEVCMVHKSSHSYQTKDFYALIFPAALPSLLLCFLSD